MKMYFAGADANNGQYAKILEEEGVERRLTSYFYNKNLSDCNFKDTFIDSGAFSAWTREVEIDIDDYIAFLKHFRHKITTYATLDVIGDPEGTLHNYNYMLSQGVKPLPVFHVGSNFKYLQYYLDQGVKHIALGGMVGKHKKVLFDWLDTVFYTLKPHFPIKTHAFGITNGTVLERYPFYSADGTTWLTNGIFGGYDKYENGKVKKRSDEAGKRLIKLTHYTEKARTSVRNYLKLEKYITNLWKSRGIIWK